MNSAKSNDDADKNAKKSNDDSVEPSSGLTLGEIPKIEKYITNTRIDGLQTLYQVHKNILIAPKHLSFAVFFLSKCQSIELSIIFQISFRFVSNPLVKQMC